MTTQPGWFLFDGVVKVDLETGAEERYAFGDGVFGSETPMAPRPGATAEDDGYLVTFTTDMERDCSECLVLDAADITAGTDRARAAARAHLQRHPLLLGAGLDVFCVPLRVLALCFTDRSRQLRDLRRTEDQYDDDEHDQ